MFKKIFPDLEDIGFNLIDLTQFNSNVMNNNYQKIVNLFDMKKEIINKPDDNYIYSKIDNMLDFVVNYCDENYNADNRKDFLNLLTDYEKTAIIFKDFDYYLNDDILKNWYDKLCDTDLDFIDQFLSSKCNDYKYIDEMQNIVGWIKDVKKSINNLNESDIWYESDVDTRLSSLEDLGYKYYEIRDAFIDYLEKYLIKNIPDNYLYIIKTLDNSKIEI